MEDNFKSDSKSFTKFKTVNIILSLSAVIWTMGWSFYTYNKFLPLSKADVILSESDIVIIQSNSCGALETKSCDIIQPIIRNVGKAIAKNISFKVYIFPIDNKVEFVKDNRQTISSTRQGLVNQRFGLETKMGRLEDDLLDRTIDKEVFKRKQHCLRSAFGRRTHSKNYGRNHPWKRGGMVSGEDGVWPESSRLSQYLGGSEKSQNEGHSES